VQVGVEVTKHRPPHRVEHGGVHVRRARAAQKSLRRLELGEVHPVRVADTYCERKLRVLSNT